MLTSGRAGPAVREDVDSVHVVIERRVMHPGVMRLIGDADGQHHLTQRERIALGLLGQSEGMHAADFVQALELHEPESLKPWLSRLLELKLVKQTGHSQATRYFVSPTLLRGAGLDGRTTLTRIEPRRLKALIVEDLRRHPESSAVEIRRRVSSEIPERTFRRTLAELVKAQEISATGQRRWRRYSAGDSVGQQEKDGR